jgi:bifunctional DNase/RNase
MTVMQIREIRLCPAHRTAIVRLDDSERRLTMTFAADPHEASRLARVMEHGPRACHPMLDFVGALLGSFEAGVVRVVLDDVQGEGIAGLVYVGWGGAELPVPCYPPDAIALALRTRSPILVDETVIDHARNVDLSADRDDPKHLKKWLEELDPDDLGKYKM